MEEGREMGSDGEWMKERASEGGLRTRRKT